MSCFNIQLKVIGSDLDPIPWKTFRIRQNDADPSDPRIRNTGEKKRGI